MYTTTSSSTIYVCSHSVCLYMQIISKLYKRAFERRHTTFPYIKSHFHLIATTTRGTRLPITVQHIIITNIYFWIFKYAYIRMYIACLQFGVHVCWALCLVSQYNVLNSLRQATIYIDSTRQQLYRTAQGTRRIPYTRIYTGIKLFP